MGEVQRAAPKVVEFYNPVMTTKTLHPGHSEMGNPPPHRADLEKTDVSNSKPNHPRRDRGGGHRRVHVQEPELWRTDAPIRFCWLW